MLRAYRLVYLGSPEAPPKLWEWQQPDIDNLLDNVRRFHTARVAQRYFRNWAALARANARIWDASYRTCPLYDDGAGWEAFLDTYRVLIGGAGHRSEASRAVADDRLAPAVIRPRRHGFQCRLHG